MKSVPRIAVIGCGAIARRFHVPALKRHRDVARAAIFVDSDVSRARALAAESGSSEAADNINDIIGLADAAIVCVPHHLHVPICERLLQAGIHVLCEKPLAERPSQVDTLVTQARASRVALAVNHTRRAYPSMREIARIVHANELGAVQKVVIRWGERFDWDAASGFYFGAQAHQRGALLDRGAHVLDLVCWWLRGEPSVSRYRDDTAGGNEATAELLFLHGATEGRIELSWLVPYENTIEIIGERATIRCGVYDWRTFTITNSRDSRNVELPTQVKSPRQMNTVIIDNFLDVVHGFDTPLVPAESARDSISLIAAAYAVREPLPQPWHDVYQRVIDA